MEEWLVSAVMSMYTGAKTVARTVSGNSSGFEVKVGMHQGSALSPVQGGRVAYVAEVLVVIQYNVLHRVSRKHPTFGLL